MMQLLNHPLGFLLLLTATAAEAQPLTPDVLSEIDMVASHALAEGAMPGLAIVIRGSDGTNISRVYGAAVVGTDHAIDEGSVFRLGSISKLVTSAIAMKLVEDGALALDTPVRELLRDRPGFIVIPASVTVRHLLNHTSGLPDYTLGELEEGVARGYFEDDSLVTVLGRPPESEAGEIWKYSDANYGLLTIVIEEATRLPYDRYVEEVFAPAVGLQSLRTCDRANPQKVNGYLATANGFVPEPAYDVRGLQGAGGLCSTASDLAALPERLIDGRWITSESLEQMLAPTVLNDGVTVDYGLGVRGGRLGDLDAWGHTGGGLHGAWATFAYYPASGVSIAVLANGTGSSLDASVIHARVAETVLRPRMLADTGLNRAELELIGGIYSRGNNLTCIVVTDGKLFRKRVGNDAPPIRLLAQDRWVFGRSDYPLDRIVFQAANGPSPSYHVYYDGLFAEYWVRITAADTRSECGATGGR